MKPPTTLVPPIIKHAATSALGTYAAYLAYGLTHPRLLRQDRFALDLRLPGDDIVFDPHWCTTFTTEIRAPRSDVWPWLVQMGWGRAGYYSWYRFDNDGVPSADHIRPELQDLQIGDVIPDGPRWKEGFGVWRVHTLDRPHAFILVSRRNPFSGREIPENDRSGDPFIDCSWAFVLEETSASTCKLIVRVRARIERVKRASLLARTMHLVFGVGDTVMERSLLAGVKQRAERNVT